jgi:hypothetical protein
MVAGYLRCYPRDMWEMAVHRQALMWHAARSLLPEPHIYVDNGSPSRGPLPQRTRLLDMISHRFYQVLIIPGPFVLSLDDSAAQETIRWIRTQGCEVLELPADHLGQAEGEGDPAAEPVVPLAREGDHAAEAAVPQFVR